MHSLPHIVVYVFHCEQFFKRAVRNNNLETTDLSHFICTYSNNVVFYNTQVVDNNRGAERASDLFRELTLELFLKFCSLLTSVRVANSKCIILVVRPDPAKYVRPEQVLQ